MLERPHLDLADAAEIFRVVEVGAHDSSLIDKIIEIDLTTFSEPTWSHYTAGLMLRPGRTFLVKEGELLIGTCQASRAWGPPNAADLFASATRPGYRNRGLGPFFLSGVPDILRSSGCRSVVLEVDPTNRPAIKVYTEKFGFQRVCELRDEYGPGRHRIQMRLMLHEYLRPVAEFPQAGRDRKDSLVR